MKKGLIIPTIIVVIVLLCSCGKTGAVQKIIPDSEIYSKAEIESAMNTVIKEFRKSFDGCELLKIEYCDEETLKEAKNYGSGEVMVLLSEFETGSSFDGSLEPNSKYSDYKWVLVRTKLGGWKLEDRGYA